MAVLVTFRPAYAACTDRILYKLRTGIGAMPQPHHFDEDSAGMRTLLPHAQRQSILYPPGVAREHTPLDRVLRTKKYTEAHTPLAREVTGMSLRKVWADAVKQERLDILCALLLLERFYSNRLKPY